MSLYLAPFAQPFALRLSLFVDRKAKDTAKHAKDLVLLEVPLRQSYCQPVIDVTVRTQYLVRC